jgi:hypothetical protein
VTDLGDAPLPAFVAVELSGDVTVRETVPVEDWLAGSRREILDIPIPDDATVVGAEVDPDRLLPDIDRTNNAWSP